jgi:hypothetical protein
MNRIKWRSIHRFNQKKLHKKPSMLNDKNQTSSRTRTTIGDKIAKVTAPDTIGRLAFSVRSKPHTRGLL